MMRLPKFEYRSARTVEEALGWLGEFEGGADKDPEARAMLMAGGTDVLPNMKHRIFTPQVVVGLRAIPELRGMVYDPAQGLRIGAGVPLNELATAPLVREHYPALAIAAEAISTPQLREDRK